MTDRPITPYAPFEDPPRSITPQSMPAVSEAPPSQPSTFTQEIRAALDLVEQSITENVKRALQRLGTAVLAKQDETRTEIKKRFDAHASELKTIRGALERQGTMLPPPPEGL